MTTSAVSCAPSFKYSVSPSNRSVSTPVSTVMPLSSNSWVSMAEAVSLRFFIIRAGAASSTVTWQPYFFKSHAASRPTTPPPMTTACFRWVRNPFTSWMSFRVRMVLTLG